MCNQNPRRCAGDGRFEVIGQSAASSEPCERPFDHPSSRQDLERGRPIREGAGMKGASNSHSESVRSPAYRSRRADSDAE